MTKTGVIGSGSWATALVSILSSRNDNLYWWVRDRRFVSFIKRYHRNPYYLSSLEIHIKPENLTFEIEKIVGWCDVLFVVVPSIYIESTLNHLKPEHFESKIIVSAAKGLIPSTHSTISDYFYNTFQIAPEKFVFLTGPSHAEEVARQKLTYLTVASESMNTAREITGLLQSEFIKTRAVKGVRSLEFAAALKNIYAIAAGMAHAIGYGDNFLAVLISNSIREMNRFLTVSCGYQNQKIMNSGYLGDLLVTAFSQFSRNRTFGNMVGHGYSPRAAILEMNMVPEGFYAVQSFYGLLKNYRVKMPVVKLVYDVLYRNQDPAMAFKKLENKLT